MKVCLTFQPLYCLRDSKTHVCETEDTGAHSHQQMASAVWGDQMGGWG